MLTMFLVLEIISMKNVCLRYWPVITDDCTAIIL